MINPILTMKQIEKMAMFLENMPTKQCGYLLSYLEQDKLKYESAKQILISANNEIKEKIPQIPISPYIEWANFVTIYLNSDDSKSLNDCFSMSTLMEATIRFVKESAIPIETRILEQFQWRRVSQILKIRKVLKKSDGNKWKTTQN